MSSRKPSSASVLRTVNSALRLLEKRVEATGTEVVAEPLPSLYEQCLLLSESIKSQTPEPVRTIHHFACTGGTLLSRHLMGIPNVRLLSESDPLSTMSPRAFAPTDVPAQIRDSGRPVDDEVFAAVFVGGIQALYDSCARKGERLVIRDHPHSHFCTEVDFTARPTTLDILSGSFETRSVVTVRHPLDSFLSLQHNGWITFAPASLDEYARRYNGFLAAHKGVVVFKYEDFIDDKLFVMQQMCDVLELPFDRLAFDLVSAFEISGDSGRKGADVSARPRRPVPSAIEEERRTSEEYLALCRTLDYVP